MMAPSTIGVGGHRLFAVRRHAEAFAGRLQLDRLDCTRSDVESDNRLGFAKHAKHKEVSNAYSLEILDYGRNGCATTSATRFLAYFGPFARLAVSRGVAVFRTP